MQEKNAYVQTTIVVKGKMVTGPCPRPLVLGEKSARTGESAQMREMSWHERDESRHHLGEETTACKTASGAVFSHKNVAHRLGGGAYHRRGRAVVRHSDVWLVDRPVRPCLHRSPI